MTHHIGPDGPGPCGADPDKGRGCPFGGPSGTENHYATEAEAQAEYDRRNEDKIHAVLKKSNKDCVNDGVHFDTAEEAQAEWDKRNADKLHTSMKKPMKKELNTSSCFYGDTPPENHRCAVHVGPPLAVLRTKMDAAQKVLEDADKAKQGISSRNPQWDEAQKNYREAKIAWNKARQELGKEERNVHRRVLTAKYFGDDVPADVTDAVYAKAWEEGHPNGDSGVETRYDDLARMVSTAYFAGRRPKEPEDMTPRTSVKELEAELDVVSKEREAATQRMMDTPKSDPKWDEVQQQARDAKEQWHRVERKLTTAERYEHTQKMARDHASSDIPRRVTDVVYAQAWERGHSGGFHEVENHYQDLIDLAEKAYRAGQEKPY